MILRTRMDEDHVKPGAASSIYLYTECAMVMLQVQSSADRGARSRGMSVVQR